MDLHSAIILIAVVAVNLAIYLYFSNRIRQQGQLMLAMRENLDRQERELASLERLSGKTGADLKKLSTDLSRALVGLVDDQTLITQRIEALEKEYAMLEKKMVQIPSSEISGENARQLLDSPLVTEILELLRQGVPPMEIARQKGMQVGEVALIKSLQQFAPKE